MDDTLKDRFYILAKVSLADELNRILKQGEIFGIFDCSGKIRPFGFEDHGIFYQGTRFLSYLDFTIQGHSPLLLSSNVREDNDYLVVDLTNPDMEIPDFGFLPRGTIHWVRTIYLWEGRYFERMQFSHFGLKPIRFTIGFDFDADYTDIFELRGTKRIKRGVTLPPKTEESGLTLGYAGLDQVQRLTHISFNPAPSKIRQNGAEFLLDLVPHERKQIIMTVSCLVEGENLEAATPEQAFHINRENFEHCQTDICRIETSNEQFNDWIHQSRADLHMLLTKTSHGLYPYAGIPWFSTIFGRDGIITALETLWFYPDIARGVLSYLASRQAREVIPEQDAEPGKILHEERKGEMAALKEIPFGRYYGTVDATPLFVLLAGRYYERTADKAFISKLWPNIEAALEWINRYGDIDGDGFIDYQCKISTGLSNQGWKDSEDSIFHENGNLAEAPIALCEIQGYVYEAKLLASHLAHVLGHGRKAVTLRKEAEKLKKNFLNQFWCPSLSFYALALDGKKKMCRVRSSNAGHCLFTGIAEPSHAEALVKQFLSSEFFSGWGIRTVPSTELRYNPMSYHNCSARRHKKALTAYGLAGYGLKEEAIKILGGLFDASLFLELHRLPELICGFERRPREGPTLYPVACDPQAWAACSVFLLLQACMGLSIQAHKGKIIFEKPSLPSFLQEVHILNLKVGDSVLDISLRRHTLDVGVNVNRKEGNIEVIATK